MGSVGSQSGSTIVPNMKIGDDYNSRKAMIDAKVTPIVDKDGLVIIGDENSNFYHTLSINTQGNEYKYQLTEFTNGEPSSHIGGNVISAMLEKFFISDKNIKRLRR